MRRNSKSKSQVKNKGFLWEEILEILSKANSTPLNYKQIAAKLNVTDQAQRQLINQILAELKSQEVVIEVERGKFKLKKEKRLITGKVDMTSSGTAYIISEDTEEDVIISSKNTLNALHGDIVNVQILKKVDGREEGKIVEVIERARTQFVGTVQLSEKFAFLVPNNNRIHIDIYIPLNKLNGVKDGQMAIAKINEWPKNGVNPIGEIVEILGNVGENNAEMHAILAEYGLPYEFPKDVERAADLIPTKITQDEIDKRRDFRGITTFTIDPVDAKDFDDALSIRKLENGFWEVGVHIADVSHYVKPNSIIDKEAIARATSIYLVDRVVPMLPEVLSNNVCSLRPNEEKLCFSAVFELDENAEVVNEWFGRTIIESDRRFTYEEAQKIIETEEGDFCSEILTLDKLAKTLRQNRFKKGSIAFERAEVKFHLDEVGNPIGVFFKTAQDSNQLIEDFMLLANRKVAEFIGKENNKSSKSKESKRAFVYRVHDKPDPEKLSSFSQFVGKFGYELNIKSQENVADSLNKLLKNVEDKKEGNMIELLAIRTMSKAIYTTKNIGHYGLGFGYYTHFTSPIRRYPDVMAHRLLQHYLDGGKSPNINELEEQCKHSSDMEKLAADAERASIKYKQVEFLIDKVGQEYDGIISGVTEWGIFVEIVENHCEGMVRIRELKDDYYIFDEENYCLRGRKNGKKLSLGDNVRIEIKKADLSKKQLDFTLVESNENRAPEKATRKEFEKKKENKPNNTPGKNFDEEWGFEI